MKFNCASPDRRANERGFFLVVVLLIMAAIMLLYGAANSRRLTNLKTEIRQIEQRQVQRLNRFLLVATNHNAALTVTPSPAP